MTYHRFARVVHLHLFAAQLGLSRSEIINKSYISKKGDFPMNNIFKTAIIFLLAAVVILIIAVPAFGARGEVASRAAVEYKVVNDLGKRSTISKMDKALDSFTEQQKGKAIIEIDLKKFGDEGWELVTYDRETGFAIFKRTVQEKK
jgi:hypothetical protein